MKIRALTIAVALLVAASLFAQPAIRLPDVSPKATVGDTIDDVTNNSAIASLRWEKLRVPFKISVDLPSTVRASIGDALRGGKHWDPNAWAAAARWELRNGDVDTALKYADKALEYGNTVTTLRTKAAVLDKKGDKAGAKALRDRAAGMANE